VPNTSFLIERKKRKEEGVYNPAPCFWWEGKKIGLSLLNQAMGRKRREGGGEPRVRRKKEQGPDALMRLQRKKKAACAERGGHRVVLERGGGGGEEISCSGTLSWKADHALGGKGGSFLSL